MKQSHKVLPKQMKNSPKKAKNKKSKKNERNK